MVLESAAPAPQELMRLARATLDREPHLEGASAEVSSFDAGRLAVGLNRKALHIDPRSALSWLDLARAYATLGLVEKATWAAERALYLAPDNRLVLRGFGRLLVESDDGERAHNLFLQASTLGTDPWIMSAEIATAPLAGRTSVSMRKANRLLEARDLSPFHMSELASAAGTALFETGHDRKAKRLIRQSLEQPTDNTLAQAEWLENQVANLGVTVDVSAAPFPFEARARLAVERQDWQEALDESHLWFHDESFSLDAAIFGTWVALTGLEEWDQAITIAHEGLRHHPDNSMLLNNLAFAQLNAGLMDDAYLALQRLTALALTDADRPVAMATSGLFEYRLGNIEEGRRLYEAAIRGARGSFASRVQALASAYRALEELRVDTPEAHSFVMLAREFARGLDYPDVRTVIARLPAE